MVKSIPIVFIIFSIWSEIALAELMTQLSRTNIDELESVELTIRANGTRSVEELDLTELEVNFQIMNTNTSSQYQYINGNEQSWVDYQITLKPKKPGQLVIPSLNIGTAKSKPINLTVRPISKSLRKEINELVFFEVETSKKSIYVQEQLIFTRRLIYSNGVQLYNEIPGPPKIENALVLTLGETKSGTTQRNGKKYGVVEQTFAIFSEKSGFLEIPSINITASVRLIEGGRVSRKGVRVSTQKIKTEVVPVPSVYPKDKPWLPAHAVILSQTITPSTNNDQVNVGETLERRIRVRIDGNTGSILPSLSSQLPANLFREYPASPVIEDDMSGSSVTGFRTETSSVVPLQPGELLLGKEQITWWDTISDELRNSKLDSTQVSVTGSPIQLKNTEQTESITSEKKQTDNSIEAEENRTPSLSTEPSYWKEVSALIISFAFLCLVFLGLNNKKGNHDNRKMYRNLIRSTRTNDAKIIKVALQQIQSSEIDQRSMIVFTQILTILNDYLYQDKEDTFLTKDDQKKIDSLTRELNQLGIQQQNRRSPYALPPLYNH